MARVSQQLQGRRPGRRGKKAAKEKQMTVSPFAVRVERHRVDGTKVALDSANLLLKNLDGTEQDGVGEARTWERITRKTALPQRPAFHKPSKNAPCGKTWRRIFLACRGSWLPPWPPGHHQGQRDPERRRCIRKRVSEAYVKSKRRREKT